MKIALSVLAFIYCFVGAYSIFQKEDGWKNLIPTILPNQAARMISEGRDIVVLDIREPEEFKREHIPTALNIPHYKINSSDLSLLKKAELIIPYCSKDFRGFEAARKLKGYGLDNIFIFEGFGLSSWIHSNLPVAGQMNKITDETAKEMIKEILK